MPKKKGTLFVVSGPSGAGKGTLCRFLMDRRDLHFSVSMTTRSPRPGEQEGVNYYFVTPEEYQKTLEEAGFLEYAEVFGNRYGTPRAQVLRYLEEGTDVLLDIDTQGALQVKANYPDAVLIFILPPTLEELERRLEGRGTETEEVRKRRLSEALREIGLLDTYKYYVINREIDAAGDRLIAIVDGERAGAPAEDALVNGKAAELIRRYREEEVHAQ